MAEIAPKQYRPGKVEAFEDKARELRAREKTLARAIIEIMEDYARKVTTQAINEAARYFPTQKVKKAIINEFDARTVEQLRTLFERYGLRIVSEHADAASGEVASLLRPSQTKTTLVNAIIDRQARAALTLVVSTREQIQGIVNELTNQAFQTRPMPSAGGLARQIRDQVKGEAGTYFKPAKASAVARTEIGMAQNNGTGLGYLQSDPEDEIEWLAHKGPGHRHGDLHGQRIKVSDAQSPDKSRWFRGPLEKPMRWPQDTEGAVGDIVNCECAIRLIKKGW